MGLAGVAILGQEWWIQFSQLIDGQFLFPRARSMHEEFVMQSFCSECKVAIGCSVLANTPGLGEGTFNAGGLYGLFIVR